MPNLTKRTVDATKAAEGRDVVIWDMEVPGFGLRVKPGGRKSYIVQFRNRQGRSRRLTLGTHGVLTPPAAIRIPTSAKQPIYKHDISQPQVLHYFRPRNGQVGGNHRRTQPERFHH